MRNLLAFAAISLAIGFPAHAQIGGQMNEAAFAKRAEANKGACDAALPVVAVDHPANVMAALEANRAPCLEAREVEQYGIATKHCQIRASRKASPQISVQMAFKACMQSQGYDVADGP
jgi:hypothetical protein